MFLNKSNKTSKSFLLIIIFFFSLLSYSQNFVEGITIDDKGNLLSGVLIEDQLGSKKGISDKSGKFTFYLESSELISFTLDGYSKIVLQVFPESKLEVVLTETKSQEESFQDSLLSVINLSDDQFSDENDVLDNISGLLQSTEDVFLRTAAYEFSSSFFRVRGLDSENATVMINGLPMNKMYNGRPQWSNWGGLNDVLRNRELTQGMVPSDYTIGGILGSTNISTRASEYSKGGRLTISSSNRSYNYRALASYGTGLLPNGWSAAIAMGNRWGASGFQDGTFYDAQSFFVSLEKQWSNHALNATIIATPNRRGKSSPNTQEVYDLKGIKYNEYWGSQNGKVRNSRVKRLVEPIVMFNHKWNISPSMMLKTNIGVQFGELGNSRLDYPGGANPSGAYYQKLPSYFLTQDSGPDYEGAYRSEQEFIKNGQLSWNRIYDANINNNINGLSSAYVLYEDRSDDTQISANTMLRTQINDNISIFTSLQRRVLNSRNFAQIIDMLGSSGYLNVDSYDGFQYDLNNPNKISRIGDKIRYNYEFDATTSEASVLSRFNYPKFSGYLGAGFSSTSYQRNGLYLHEAYPGSFGKSKKLSFSGVNLKAGLTYKITGRHVLQGNVSNLNRAPSLRNSFSNSRETNFVIGEQAGLKLKNERIVSGDLNYFYRSPMLNARFSVFQTSIEDANEISFFFAEGIGGDNSSFVQEIMQGISKKYQGLEVGIEGQILPSLKLKGAASVGEYIYGNNPNVYLTSDDFGYLDFGEAKMKNLKIATGAQHAYSFGFEFRENYWWFGMTSNYFENTYLDVSPINRTQNFLIDRDGLPFNDYDVDLARSLLEQEKFDPYFVVNMILGKSWRVGSNFVGVFLSVNNLLGEEYKTGGFEQSRNANYRELRDEVQAERRRFGPKYWYGRGTTYFLNTYFRF